MDSSISVQAFATQRNGQAELLIDYLLGLALAELKSTGVIKSYTETELHKSFKTQFISDIFDHYFTAELRDGSKYEFWGQTTCYKGNDTSAPEPNKTYEIRETLIEGLGLRAALIDKGTKFRTLHFTLGPTSYTYSWFPAAKDNAYDLSLYLPPQIDGTDLFAYLAELLQGVSTEFQVKQRFEKALTENNDFKEFVDLSIKPIIDWFKNDMPEVPMANQQAQLLLREAKQKQPLFNEVLKSSKRGGEDIKGRALKLLRGETETTDAALTKTLEALLGGNPFLKNAIEALDDWDDWFEKNIPPVSGDLKSYFEELWSLSLPERLVVRRLLIRLNTGESVRYPADLQIAGITEHNLYNGNHNPSQISEIADRVVARYKTLGISSEGQLSDSLKKNGKRLLKQSLRLESYNGTSLKPSFLFVENSLSELFSIVDFRTAGLEPPVAYYSEFGEFNVNPYSNMKVVVNKSNGKPIAIIKAKYFRRQEFPRRSKEESYVGLTTKYELKNDEFKEKYGLPIIMFVDMDKELSPPEYSVLRMFTSGWDVFFSVTDLNNYLQKATHDGK